MVRKQRIKAAPFTLWLIPGSLISIVVFFLAVLLLAVTPWGICGRGGAGPPEPLDLPLVSSSLGWFVVVSTVGFTALGIWLDRGREKRIDPVARVALCLAVLGIAEAISGADSMASCHAWPVNLVHVAFWILVAAMAVGVVSWIRLLLAKGAMRGWIFAVCVVLCSAGAAHYLATHLFEYGPPLPDDGIELPIFRASWDDKPSTYEYRPELRIGVDGPEDLPDFAEVAGRMKKDTYGPPSNRTGVHVPNDPLLIRADARAKWSAVREVIEEAYAVEIWKVQIATRWEIPATQTKICMYLPVDVGMINYTEDPPPPHRAVLHGDGSASFDGETFESAEGLVVYLDELTPEEERREPRILRFEPDDDARWQDVLSVVEAWTTRHGEEIVLGDLPVNVE